MADVSEPAKPEVPTRRSKRKAANKEKEAQLLAAAEENSKDEDKEAPTEDSPSRSTNSPDPNCAICLSKLENKSFTDSCFHMFCFVCLLEWSKIKAECPLCKQPFKSIIHNVRSYDDYDQYHLEKAENQFSYDTQNDRRFRYRTTMTNDHSLMFGFRPRRLAQYTEQVSSLLTTTMTTRQHWRRQRQTATSEFRRRVYMNGMRVVGLPDASGRSRNISPEFFASNPATTHRLVPWLNRELNALLYNHEEHVQFVLELILGLVKRFPIESDEFYQHVYPFVGRNTRHFMHEFVTFAKSPFCITSYDQKAVYEQQPEFVSDSDSVHSNGNDSDVMIVSPNSAPTETRRRRRDPGAPRQQNSRTEIIPMSVSLRDLLEDEDEPITSHSGWESPIPGPSWHFNSNALGARGFGSSSQPGTSSLTSRNLRKNKSSDAKEEDDGSSTANLNSESQIVDSDSESGSDVMCVGYDKPWQERTPVVVSTDSEEEKVREKAEKAKRKKLKMEKREEELKKRRKRSRSRSHSGSRSRHNRFRSRSSSRSNRKSRSPSASRSHNRYSKSRSRRSRSKSSSHHGRYPSHGSSPHSRSRHGKRDRSRSIAYEDAFGYSRRTSYSPERTRRRRKQDHQRSSRYSDSSRSKSRSPSRRRRDRRKHQKESRRRSRSSSVEVMSSRHRHKKHKKHKRSRDSDKDKDKDNEENVHYKIVNDKEGKKSKGDPLLSITIKRDKSEDFPVVSSTVDAHVEIEMPENVVIRTEPITPPRPGEAVVETVSNTSGDNLSNDTQQKLASDKPTENPRPNKEDSDSSNESTKVRRKHFKKHPSGHKKSRRPLPKIPDPTTSTVTSSTPVTQSENPVPVLDAISQLFQGYNTSGITSTQIEQDSLIPGMMANFFDSRLSHLYGYTGSSLLSDYMPRSVPPQVTSTDQPLVLSSSDDSDVVVESVMKGSGQAVSSTSMSRRGQGYQGMMYNIMDSIPVISDDINSHKSVDVEATIDVEELDNDSLFFPAKSVGSRAVEVLDSGDEVEATRNPNFLGQSGHEESTNIQDDSEKEEIDVESLQNTSKPKTSGKKLSVSQTSSSNSKEVESTLAHKGNSGDEEQLVDVETCGGVEPSTSADVLRESEAKTNGNMGEKLNGDSSTEDESMDIDVTGLSVCGDGGNLGHDGVKPSSGRSSPVGQLKNIGSNSEESMDIDVVGGVDAVDTNREHNTEENGVTCDISEGNRGSCRTDPQTLSRISPNNLAKVKENTENSTEFVEVDGFVDSSENVCAASQVGSDTEDKTSDGINVSSSSQIIVPNLETEPEVDSESSGRKNAFSNNDESSSSPRHVTVHSSDSEEELTGNSRPPLIEGASEISSDEESLVQMHQPKIISDASDISSEEVSFEEGSPKACIPNQSQPQVIADDTSSDEGEISSDSDHGLSGAINVSSDDLTDSDEASSRTRNEVPDSHKSRSGRMQHSPTQNHPLPSTSKNQFSVVSSSRSTEKNVEEEPASSKDESRSSGELSDDSSGGDQVYDDISSSEDFDSPSSPQHHVTNGQPSSSSAGQTREESLSEGEIVSD